MNTQYRKNLKDVATACKNYTDKRFEDFKWELGTHTIDTTTDSDVAYQKQAPNGTIGCQINSVGGMSYKSENLLVLEDSTFTSSGITFTISGGKISSSGTSSTTGWITLKSFSLIAGSYSYNDFSTATTKVYFLNTSYQQLNPQFSLSETSTIYLAVKGSTIINNGQLINSMPMLVKGSTAPTTFKQGFDGIRDSTMTSVKLSGLNLFDNSAVTLDKILNSSTGVITNDSNSFISDFIPVLSGLTYNYNLGVQFGTAFYDSNKNYVSGSVYSTTFTIPSGISYIRMSANKTRLPNLMICKGTTIPTAYKPYITPITKTIPASIQALAGYGWGINDTCYNYIDFNAKKFVQKVGRVDLGSFNYTYNASNHQIFASGTGTQAQLGFKAQSITLTKLYTYATTFSDFITTDKCAYLSTDDNLYIRDSAYTDATTFKTAMSGVYLYYELATPVETDISSYITDNDKFLEVEPLGTITFTNTYEQEVPSEITYLTEVAK